MANYLIVFHQLREFWEINVQHDKGHISDG